MKHFISVADAASMIALYRKKRPAMLQPAFDIAVLPLGETFERSAIDTLLARPGCVAVRIYYGMDDSNKIHAVLVGVDSNNEDILPEPTNAEEAVAENYFQWHHALLINKRTCVFVIYRVGYF